MIGEGTAASAVPPPQSQKSQIFHEQGPDGV